MVKTGASPKEQPSKPSTGAGAPLRAKTSMHRQQRASSPASASVSPASTSASPASTTASSSSSSNASSTPLPQCKVKRNYACAKCNYYTQNPRSFLHHQKNVHAERIKVYECSHCLYASKHSQKLHRHVHMVHTSNRKGGGPSVATAASAKSPPPLVPPVRIRVRFEKHSVVRPSDDDDPPVVRMADERRRVSVGGEPRLSDRQAAVEPSEEREDEGDDEEETGDDEDGAASEPLPSPPPPPQKQQQLKKKKPQQQQHRRTDKQQQQASTFIRCSVCAFGSHSQTLVNKHEKTAHLKKKFFRCMKCNYVTHMRARYTKHVKYHTMPMIKCADCDFQTPYKWNLDRHNRNHSTVKPGTYQCSHCSFSADIKQSLTVHETNHHVPPVGGGVLPAADVGRRYRRYRVGASDAPGSAVDGTEIVTYERTTDGGVIEIMTETKSTTPMPVKSDPVKCEPVKEETVQKEQPPAAPAARRRPMPQLIPISAKQTSSPPPHSQLQPPIPKIGQEDAASNAPPGLFVECGASEDASERRSGGSVRNSVSPKGKTASFFDKLKAQVDGTADLTCQVCRHESKCLSEFMRHKRTHASSREDDENNASPPAPPTMPALEPLRPPMPVTAAELKSTRCQRCRKRCKTSAELVTHLATCRGAPVPPPVVAVMPKVESADEGALREPEEPQRPTEKKIFVWNTAVAFSDDTAGAEPTSAVDSAGQAEPEPSSSADERNHNDHEDDGGEDPFLPITVKSLELLQIKQLQQQPRKEGKIYKTVFKCPHCTFWAATASRFHVHIVGHLNRKPFECSCCAYRSNWRWDITKHIRLKSARRLGSGGAEESQAVAAANLHHGAKVLMTDETGRRNYSKYNRYLTVMEMDFADGADNRVAGGDYDDGKTVAFRKVVGGGAPRKRRSALKIKQQQMAATKPAKMPTSGRVAEPSSGREQHRQQQSAGRVQLQPVSSGRVQQRSPAAVDGGGGPAKKLKRRTENASDAVAESTIPAPPSPVLPTPQQSMVAGSDNRTKTMWKCKKCFFRDSDRLTVLNHVKAHYRRGEFNAGSNKQKPSSAAHNQKKVEKEKTSEPTDTTAEEKTPSIDRRKHKTPSTGTTNETTLMLSTNLKSFSNYDDENFLSCPLCDVTASSSTQLKEHMQLTHIPEGTKYRCEYCPFWSEDKNAMLDHMMQAHEMDEGNHGGKTSNCYRNDPWEESGSNHGDDRSCDDPDAAVATATADSEEFEDNGADNCSGGDDDLSACASSYNALGDESIVVVETIGHESSIEENKNSDNSSNQYDHSDGAEEEKRTDDEDGESGDEDRLVMNEDDVSGDEDRERERVGEQKEEEEDFEEETKESKPDVLNIVEMTVRSGSADPSDHAAASSSSARPLYECPDCWYYSTSRHDVNAHRRLHVARGALYNCSVCVFNVSRVDALYHHYRYGHGVDEPELRYPEDAVVRAGYRNLIAKNLRGDEDADAAAASAGPPMVWSYHEDAEPRFAKVFKCRYCPHTNRRRHNTVEHERMHSDHPDHQEHRQQQHRMCGGGGFAGSPTAMHPCKRCTYVCNNAGVLASHLKVHVAEYGASSVGFHDPEIFDAMQMQALEYVMDLERRLRLAGDGDDDEVDRTVDDDRDRANDECGELKTVCAPLEEYSELDEPELKFCSSCPARYFFISDLRCHERSHRYRAWPHACPSCTFVSRAPEIVLTHARVHSDDYERRTAELVEGYRVSSQHPRFDWKSGCKKDAGDAREYRVALDTDEAAINGDDRQEELLLRQQSRRTKKRPRPETDDSEEISPARKRLSWWFTERRENGGTESEPESAGDVKTEPGTSDGEKTSKKKKKTNGTAIKQYQCDKCPGQFSKATALYYHKSMHGGDGPHRCRACDYAVSTYGNMRRHETVHEDLPPRDDWNPDNVAAVEPGNAASQEDDVAEYGPPFYYPTTVKNGVSKPKRYRCAKCPSAFDKRSQYTVHLTLHGAGDKFRCDKCDYSVRYSANYVQHQRKHARDAEMRRSHREQLQQATVAQPEKAQPEKAQPEKAQPEKAQPVEEQPYEEFAAEEVQENEDEQEEEKEDEQEEKEDEQEEEKEDEQEEEEDDDRDRGDDVVFATHLSLDPRNTVFRNEISDRQTAYELNAAYGPSIEHLSVEPVEEEEEAEGAGDWYRCTHCPFECGSRAQLKRHVARHAVDGRGQEGSAGYLTPAEYKRGPGQLRCRFCTYGAHKESELTEHARVHFIRSAGSVLSSVAAFMACPKDVANAATAPADRVEFHGKRIDAGADANGTGADEADAAPFLVFRDGGVSVSRAKRFSPDPPTPTVLIDFNDNRTMDASKTTMVRIANGGKLVEFVDARPKEVILREQQLRDEKRLKRSKKH